MVDRTAQTCKFYNITEENRSIFGISDNPQTVFSPAQFFNFDDTKQKDYKGRYTVRGIRCDRWDTVFNVTWTSQTGGVSYYDYVQSSYFSIPEWKFGGIDLESQSRIPIRNYIKGQIVVDKGLPTESVQIVDYFADYTDFSITLEAGAFVPQAYCSTPVEEPLPPDTIKSFSALIEVNNVINQESSVRYQYWDYTNNIARIDVISVSGDQTVYIDGARLAVFTLDKQSDTCKRQPYTESAWFNYFNSNGKYQLRN